MGSSDLKKLSDSFTTGGGGISFEYNVQALFLLSLLIEGFSPVLNIPIKKVFFQAKRLSCEIDDLVVEANNEHHSAKLYCQIKHTLTISEKDYVFQEVINAAWADFKKDKFDKKYDKIALVTSFIAKDSINSLRVLNDKAIHSDTAESFNQDINQSNYISEKVRNIKQKIEASLQIANNNVPVSTEEVWEFLKVFVLLIFDLDYKNSINETLTMTLIKTQTIVPAADVWARIIKYASECDRSGAIVTLDSFDVDILEFFGRASSHNIYIEQDFKSNQLFSRLVLIGSWDERNENDKEFVANVVGENYSNIEKELQEFIVKGHPYVSLQQGVWKIKNRKQIFDNSYTYYFDNFIDCFFGESVKVLLQNNARIDESTGENNILIPSNESFNYSNILRKSLVQGLCLISNKKEKIVNCTNKKIDNATYTLLNNLFSDCTWLRWASLYDLLPIIAEISPKYYLQFLEKAIKNDPESFVKLFPAERMSYLTSNYICGILWSLECLAWGEDYLVPSVRCLCELAYLKVPASNSGNTPISSLTSILLPWWPQTLATVQKRKNAIATLLKEYPQIGWKLLKNIMPGGISTTTGNYRPKHYLCVPQERDVAKSEVREMQEYIIEQALEMAGDNALKLSDIVKYFNYVNNKTIEKFFSVVDDFSKNWDDNQKFDVWLKLNDFRYELESDKEVNLNEPHFYQALCEIIEKIEPQDLFIKSKRLFLSRFDEYSMGEYSHDRWKAKEEKKKDIIKTLYNELGVDAVKIFGEQLEKHQYQIYRLLGQIISTVDICKIIDEAVSKEEWFYFLIAVLNAYLRTNGSNSIFELNLEKYDKKDIAPILCKIELSKDLVEAVTIYLVGQEELYWKNAIIPRMYDGDENYEIKSLINKLIQYKRYSTIINLLWNAEIFSIISENEMMEILSQAAKVSCIDKLDIYATQEIIKKLQNSLKSDKEKLSNIEFMYLPWLDEHSGHIPRALKTKIANNPEFFCEIIGLYYKRRNDETPHEPLDKALGERLFQLLYQFDIVPGMDWHGIFHPEKFKEWVEYTLKWATENDRSEVLQQTIGSGLSYAPKNEDGIIHECLMEVLDAKENEHMRKGYMTGIYNQRGVHFIDPEGKPEIELSSKYNVMADKVEEKGYSRFSGTLRKIADNYLRAAEENIMTYKNDANIEGADN